MIGYDPDVIVVCEPCDQRMFVLLQYVEQDEQCFRMTCGGCGHVVALKQSQERAGSVPGLTVRRGEVRVDPALLNSTLEDRAP